VRDRCRVVRARGQPGRLVPERGTGALPVPGTAGCGNAREQAARRAPERGRIRTGDADLLGLERIPAALGRLPPVQLEHRRTPPLAQPLRQPDARVAEEVLLADPELRAAASVRGDDRLPVLALGLAGSDRGQDRLAQVGVTGLRRQQLGGRGVRNPRDRIHQQAAETVELDAGAPFHDRSLPSGRWRVPLTRRGVAASLGRRRSAGRRSPRG
jgi:hypothetical protein